MDGQTLHKDHFFYKKSSYINLSDRDLIKFVFIYLDLDYIQFLFTLLSQLVKFIYYLYTYGLYSKNNFNFYSKLIS